MLKILNKKNWLSIILVLVIAVLGVFIFLSFIRSDRILDKYSHHKDFAVVGETMKANLDFIKKNPNNDSAYYSLGQGFFGLQGYDDAIWALKEAIRISPNTYYYWSFLGKAYQAKKDYPSARDAYIKTLEFEPNKPLNYTQLAWLYYFRLEPEKDKAFETLQKGFEKFPADKDILFDITRYYMYDQNKKEFLKYAPKYIKIDPKNEAINKKYQEWKK
ncbi:hypothetical protein HYW83_02955 [Candidatus Peregrinibacteria bacterium]|nr:hypothetical protein [Candidatus Peregrinibacteria bacterium]